VPLTVVTITVYDVSWTVAVIDKGLPAAFGAPVGGTNGFVPVAPGSVAVTAGNWGSEGAEGGSVGLPLREIILERFS
jgi:hypothetical protein